MIRINKDAIKNEKDIIYHKDKISSKDEEYMKINKYSKDEMFLNELYNVNFDMVSNQLFINNFLSLNHSLNSLLVYHNNNSNYDKISCILTISEEMRELYLSMNKYIIIVSSTNEIKNIQLSLFNEKNLKQNEDDEWNINECLLSSFKIKEIKSKSKSKDDVINEIKEKIGKYYKFFNYTEFTIYAENCIMGERFHNNKNLQIENSKTIFNDCLLIIDQIDILRYDEKNKLYESTSIILTKIIENTTNLRLLLLSSRPIYDNIRDIIWITNLLRKNDNKRISNIDDIFDKNDNFILPSLLLKKECGRSILKRDLLGYICYIKKINQFKLPFRLYKSSTNNDNNNNNNNSNNNNNNGKSKSNYEFIEPYLSIISGYQEKHYLQSMDELMKRKMNLFEDETIGLDVLYKIIQEPLQLLNMTYISNIEKLDKIDLKDHIGCIGFSNNVSYIDSSKGNRMYDYNYEIENFNQNEIKNYSSKIKSICEKIIDSEGTILIYSQYIYSGILPMVFALEEMGFLRYKKSIPLLSTSSTSLLNKSYIMITGDKTFSPDNKDEINAFNSIDNINGEKIKIILITKLGFQCMQRYNNIRQVHFMEPSNNINEIENVIGSIDSILPIRKRIIEIYLHASISNERIKEECIDLFMYRMIDNKYIKIDIMNQFLVECSVECLFEIKNSKYSIDDLSKLIDNKKVLFDLSNNKEKLLYNFRSRFFTNDIMTIYRFIDKNENVLVKKSIDYKDKILKIIYQLFKEKDFYERSILIELINKKKPYPLNEIYSTLKRLINKENIYFLFDQYGRNGYIEKQGNLYLFHPIKVNRNIEINSSLLLIKKEKKYSYENIIKNIETEMNIIFRNKIIGEPKLKITTMSFCNQSSKLIDRLVNIHQICMNNVKNHFLYHYLDKLNINEKLVLLEEIYTIDKKDLLFIKLSKKKSMNIDNDNDNDNDNDKDDNDNINVMNNYFNKLFVIKSNNLCIILYDGKKNVLYNTINWQQYEDNNIIIKFPIVKRNKFYLGFYNNKNDDDDGYGDGHGDGYGDGDNKINVTPMFTINDIVDNKVFFFIVEEIGLKKMFVILNTLQNQLTQLQKNTPKVIAYNENNITKNKLNKYQLVIIIEIIMRELNNYNTHTFIYPEEIEYL